MELKHEYVSNIKASRCKFRSQSVDLSLKPNFHSRISLLAGEIFAYPKYLHLIVKLSYQVVIYPSKCCLKGSEGQQMMSEYFSWAKILSATSEKYGIEIRLNTPDLFIFRNNSLNCQKCSNL